jgi:hypothetical protein
MFGRLWIIIIIVVCLATIIVIIIILISSIITGQSFIVTPRSVHFCRIGVGGQGIGTHLLGRRLSQYIVGQLGATFAKVWLCSHACHGLDVFFTTGRAGSAVELVAIKIGGV